MPKLFTLTIFLAAALFEPAVGGMRTAGFTAHDATLSLWCENGKVGAVFANVSELKQYSDWDRQALNELQPTLRIKADGGLTIDVDVRVVLAKNTLTASGDSEVGLLRIIREAHNRITASLDLPRGMGLERAFDVQGRAEKVEALIEGCGLRD